MTKDPPLQIAERATIRHDYRAEVADLVPLVAVTPPQDLNLVALSSRSQPYDGFAVVLAEQRGAFHHLLNDHAAAVGVVEGFDACQDVVVFPCHRASFGRLPALSLARASRNVTISPRAASPFCRAVRPDVVRGLKLWSPSAI
jgi:hypothetical protein